MPVLHCIAKEFDCSKSRFYFLLSYRSMYYYELPHPASRGRGMRHGVCSRLPAIAAMVQLVHQILCVPEFAETTTTQDA